MHQTYKSRILRQINLQNEMSSHTSSVGALTTSSLSCPSKRGDRFIPRRRGAKWSVHFQCINENEKLQNLSASTKDDVTYNHAVDFTYSALLRNELLGADLAKVRVSQSDDGRLHPSSSVKRRNLFNYSYGAKKVRYEADGSAVSPYAFVSSYRTPPRRIPTVPFSVLDAPELKDDFNLNLIDWSAEDVLSIGLGTCVYLWSTHTNRVTQLCDVSNEGDTITSVGWSEKGDLLSVGTEQGLVQIWDAAAEKRLSVLDRHSAKVGALAWTRNQVSSGSGDGVILQRDIRGPPHLSERCLRGHQQEVCGLKWSTDRKFLASGANDNKLLVWNRSSLRPDQQYTEHSGAVKAIAWSPHKRGLLASGGGGADQCIRFWNTLTGQPLQCTNTGSEVCNLAWSKHTNELVSTHGGPENQILVWKYPSLTHVTKLLGHTDRVLYMAMSPDGQSIVTAAADENLKFWHLFDNKLQTKKPLSMLNLGMGIR